MGSLFGGGQPDTQTAIRDVPERFQPYGDALLQQSLNQAQKPYVDYSGMTVAPMNQSQITGLGMQSGRAMSGNPIQDAAGSYMLNTFNGQNSNPIFGKQTNVAANPMMGSIQAGNVNASQNSMFGVDNPYLNSMIAKTGNDIQDQYSRGVAAQTDAAYAMTGAFGGDLHNQAIARNQSALAGALADNSNKYRFQDYTNQFNAAENFANRQQQTGLANQSAGLNAQQMNAGLYDNAINRGVNAQQTDFARDAGIFQQQQQNALGMMGNVLPFANQDYVDAQQMYQSGTPQYAYTQQLLDDSRGRFYEQQNYPSSQLDAAWRGYSNAIGNSTQSTVQQPRQSGLGSALGGIGLLGSMFTGR
jgi:hypothetical protein